MGRHALLAVLLLALVVRVGAIAIDSGYRPQNDSFDYDRFGRSIAGGDGYPEAGFLLYGGPTAIRLPGYPLLLGGVYAISGDSVLAGRLLAAALGTLIVYLIFLVAGTVWGRRTALWAAGLAAVFPPLVLLDLELLSEPLFICLELAAVLAVFAFRRSGGSLRWALAAGAACGAATLTRNAGLALIVPVAFGLWIGRPRRSLSSLAAPATMLAVAVLVMIPWIVRNEAEFGRVIPTSSGTGFILAGTYNELSMSNGSAHGGWLVPQAVPEFAPLFRDPGLDEAEVDAKLQDRALEFAGERPGYVLEASAWNLIRMFELSGGAVVDTHGDAVDQRGIGDEDPLAERIALALAVALALAGVVAIVRSARKGTSSRIPHGPWFMWAIPILALLTTAPLGGLPRYRLVADPFLLMLAGVGAAWLAALFAARSGRPA